MNATKPAQLSRDHFRHAVYPTPFHARTAAANALNLWHRWKDYTVADAYFDTELEYAALRNGCGVFDLSPMTKYRVTGTDALAYLNRLVTRDVAKIGAGRVGYCVWCDDDGQVIDDGTIFNLGADGYRLCSQERHLDWLLDSAFGFDVSIAEETTELAALAVQGPTSAGVLRRMGLAGVERLRPFAHQNHQFAAREVLVSRTGFTGDLGYELWADPALALPLWDALFAAGNDLGIRPIGTVALELSRVEAGFIQTGIDFWPADRAVRPGRTRSPFELDLGRQVDFGKPHFNGRRALLAEQARGSRYRLTRLDVAGNKPAKDAFIYNARREVVGTVTSAAWSPAAKANVALASLQMPWGRPGDALFAEIYYQKELKWSRIDAPCRVVSGPFYDPPRRRATPSADR